MKKSFFWVKPSNDEDYIWRYEKNPIIDLSKIDYWHVFNSAIVYEDGIYHCLFRVETKDGCPRLVAGKSLDGLNFEFGQPVDFKNPDGSAFVYSYAYDPRLVKINGRIFAIFCADTFGGPSTYIAETKDYINYTVLPCGFLPYNRNGVLVPEIIDGKYFMLNRPCSMGMTDSGEIFISESEDLIHWGNHKRLIRKFEEKYKNFWERIKIGAGPAPIKTKEGWLLIYHGVQGTCNGWTYSIGVALLDLKDPTKLLAKGSRYLMTPETIYERTGFCPNVLFPCTALNDEEGHITIYYGAADTNIGIAFTTVDKLLAWVKKYNLYK